jgi:hypothetical protein
MNVSPDELPVSISGWWGPRRVCTTECASAVAAEDVYDYLLASDSKFGPGSSGEARVIAVGFKRFAKYEVTANAVWRQGRVFLYCDYCSRRCTRLYMPRPRDPLRCRRCWRLTYESTQARNYRGYGFLSQRMASAWETARRREERRYESLQRWARRRQLREK